MKNKKLIDSICKLYFKLVAAKPYIVSLHLWSKDNRVSLDFTVTYNHKQNKAFDLYYSMVRDKKTLLEIESKLKKLRKGVKCAELN